MVCEVAGEFFFVGDGFVGGGGGVVGLGSCELVGLFSSAGAGVGGRDLLGGVGGYGGDLGLGEVGVSDGPQFLQELGELVGEVFGRRGE